MAIDSGLVGHWTLDGNYDDHSGNGNHGRSHGAVAMTPPNPIASLPGTAQFDGRSACITVPHSETLALGTADFSVAAWVNSNRITTDVPGDILSKFCGTSRRGFNFGIQTAAGVASSQSNWRNVFFGIDDEQVEPDWTNNGRPGNAQCVMGLAVHAGSLYAGTYEGCAGETGHVYRCAGGTAWEDCGAPADCNAVSTLAVYDGDLYAGVSCYRAQGSSLPESPNRRPGGSVYRYAGGKEWVDCGQLGDAEDVFGLAVYAGNSTARPCTPRVCSNTPEARRGYRAATRARASRCWAYSKAVSTLRVTTWAASSAMRANNAGPSAGMRALQPSSIRLRRIRVYSIPVCGPAAPCTARKTACLGLIADAWARSWKSWA